MIEVEVRGDIEKALKKLGNEYRRSGTYAALQMKQYHLTRTQRRRIKDAIAMARNLKQSKRVAAAVERDERQGRRRVPMQMRRRNDGSKAKPGTVR